ncbi:type II toxin-antitoxin system death-on-curing family toxin [Uliginosibacterium aquaticum]|uniref:Type II toxin-antitoxin system death-on-curing family toxin n=1 Tax=Uliginosibacterium aquaticum TaxID=2731212 RepID=A0ABX2ICB7_9RHOO|nr:type II toxin-antitoxin system death-on-curing family toxin [Uliginosibacterium aquaticum]NSL53617.1 type II toxin-antitoxin system death-on-curing family toxin [Uliginosibacterium aquaticum]
MSGQGSWRWVSKPGLLLLHDESLAVHGGLPGIRDEGLLDSALARAPNLAHYGEPDLAELAAAYVIGLAKNHPFVDGNKRAAFLSLGMFLFANGQRLAASQLEATQVMLGIAAGDIDEATFAAWLRQHLAPR